MSDHYPKTNQMKNKCYVLFAGSKKNLCNKQTQTPVRNR